MNILWKPTCQRKPQLAACMSASLGPQSCPHLSAASGHTCIARQHTDFLHTRLSDDSTTSLSRECRWVWQAPTCWRHLGMVPPAGLQGGPFGRPLPMWLSPPLRHDATSNWRRHHALPDSLCEDQRASLTQYPRICPLLIQSHKLLDEHAAA